MGDRPMGGDTGRFRQEIRARLEEAGAISIGFASAGEISSYESRRLESWIDEGKHGTMSWLERHVELRRNPNNVLQGAETVISLAFSYAPADWRPMTIPMIAAYAYGEDYHKALRRRLKPVLKEFKGKYGGEWRICIDSAPLPEKYWAVKSGIGRVGLNTLLFVENAGSLCFIVEILTTLPLSYGLEDNEHPVKDSETRDKNLAKTTADNGLLPECLECRKCIYACPGKALDGKGGMDARRCINYLNLEHQGGFTETQKEILEKAGALIYGCDRCLRVCPRNSNLAPTNLPEFYNPDPSSLTAPSFRRK